MGQAFANLKPNRNHARWQLAAVHSTAVLWERQASRLRGTRTPGDAALRVSAALRHRDRVRKCHQQGDAGEASLASHLAGRMELSVVLPSMPGHQHGAQGQRSGARRCGAVWTQVVACRSTLTSVVWALLRPQGSLPAEGFSRGAPAVTLCGMAGEDRRGLKLIVPPQGSQGRVCPSPPMRPHHAGHQPSCPQPTHAQLPSEWEDSRV